MTKKDSQKKLRQWALKTMCEVKLPEGFTPLPTFQPQLPWDLTSYLYDGKDSQGFPKAVNLVRMHARADQPGFIVVGGNNVEMTVAPYDLQAAVDMIVGWRQKSVWWSAYDGNREYPEEG